MTNKEKLMVHIVQNPDLQVIPMVDIEVCETDDFSRWAGDIGESCIKEYTVDALNEGCIIDKDKCDKDEIERLSNYGYKWEKAIFVNIDPPSREVEV